MTEPTVERIPTQCEECLSDPDVAPKVHHGAKTMHFDCTPQSVRRELLHEGAVHSASHAHTAAAFEGADKGLRNEKLLAHIVKAHADLNTED